MRKKLGLTGDLLLKMHVSDLNDFTHQLIVDRLLATFVVNLSNPSTEDVAIDVSFESGFAEAINDFVLPTQLLIIPAGETTGEITLEVMGDDIAEGDEEILLDLAVAENATFANGATTENIGVNIADDDSEIFVSLIEEESGVSEGDLDRPSFFSLTLNRFGGLLGSDVVEAKIAPTNNNSAATTDFIGGFSPKLITFAPGEDSKTVEFAVKPDFKIEDDETFAVELSSISGSAEIFSPDETFTIFNDDEGNSIVGNSNRNRLRGTSNIDIIEGLKGNDTLFGNKSNDVLLGGTGNDQLFGEGDNNRLFGEDDDDRLEGGLGNDTALGGNGFDILKGDNGDDSLVGGNYSDTLQGGDGDDEIFGDDRKLGRIGGNDLIFG